MTLTYNHFENKFNQLRHPENPTIDTKIVKIGPWTPKICHFRFTLVVHLGFGRKRGLKRSKIWTLCFPCYLIPNDPIPIPNSFWTNKSRQLNLCDISASTIMHIVAVCMCVLCLCTDWILYTLEMSLCNITRYCTQHNNFEAKTSATLRTHQTPIPHLNGWAMAVFRELPSSAVITRCNLWRYCTRCCDHSARK